MKQKPTDKTINRLFSTFRYVCQRRETELVNPGKLQPLELSVLKNLLFLTNKAILYRYRADTSLSSSLRGRCPFVFACLTHRQTIFSVCLPHRHALLCMFCSQASTSLPASNTGKHFILCLCYMHFSVCFFHKHLLVFSYEVQNLF